MPWTYEQHSGNLLHDGVLVHSGYAGNFHGINNPKAENIRDIGPIPEGVFTIGRPITPEGAPIGLALPLIPDPSNEMFGRGGFFIYEDTRPRTYASAFGSIIMPYHIRQQIVDSGDARLVVVD